MTLEDSERARIFDAVAGDNREQAERFKLKDILGPRADRFTADNYFTVNYFTVYPFGTAPYDGIAITNKLGRDKTIRVEKNGNNGTFDITVTGQKPFEGASEEQTIGALAEFYRQCKNPSPVPQVVIRPAAIT
jgi:hypothetical protein